MPAVAGRRARYLSTLLPFHRSIMANANNSLFNSAGGIETSTSPSAPSIFDSTGGIMSTGGASNNNPPLIPFGMMWIPQ